jgi:hypothetical protein
VRLRNFSGEKIISSGISSKPPDWPALAFRLPLELLKIPPASGRGVGRCPPAWRIRGGSRLRASVAVTT